jgi:hypothetical protein
MGAKLFFTVQLTGEAVPTVASATVCVSGSKLTPSAVAVSAYGLVSSGDVRRASTSISQTPGSGSA